MFQWLLFQTKKRTMQSRHICKNCYSGESSCKIIKSISRLLRESATKLVFRFFLRQNDRMDKVQKYGGSINFLHRASAEILLNVSWWGWQLFEEKAAPVFYVKWPDAFLTVSVLFLRRRNTEILKLWNSKTNFKKWSTS